jgi:hypothetical protein|tara:strand:+ start:26 stop:802 length:777 start_codon:yes stop_codon:yes gene_type:complete
MIKNSYFVKNFNLLKKNLDNIFLIFIFDVWFLAVLLGTSKLAEFLGPRLFSQPLESYSISPLLIFGIIYFIILTIIYSFFKYIVLHHINRIFWHTDLNFKRFGSFLLMNLVILISYLIIYFALNGIFLINVKSQFTPIMLLLIIIPFVFFSYAFLNISHSLFLNFPDNKSILKKAVLMTLTKVRSYSGIYLWSAIILAVYFILFYSISFLIVNNPDLSLQSYQIYQNASKVITAIALYLLVFFNRSYFYLITKERQKF